MENRTQNKHRGATRELTEWTTSAAVRRSGQVRSVCENDTNCVKKDAPIAASGFQSDRAIWSSLRSGTRFDGAPGTGNVPSVQRVPAVSPGGCDDTWFSRAKTRRAMSSSRLVLSFAETSLRSSRQQTTASPFAQESSEGSVHNYTRCVW